MFAAGTVASLAINAFGQRTRVYGLRKRLVISRRDLRIPVVTEHAIVTQRAAEAVMIRTIVARVHRPVASLFGVPCERQFDQLVAGGPMHVRADVITGTQNVVDLLLQHIDLFAIEIDLVSALIVFTIAPEHGEIAV